MNQYTINIPAAGGAPGIANVHVSGRYFLISALTAAVDVLTSNNEKYSFNSNGAGFGDDRSAPFGLLTFYNNTGAINNVTFFVDDKPIKLPDVNLTNSVAVTTSLATTVAQCAVGQVASTFINVLSPNQAYQFTVPSSKFRNLIVIAIKAAGTPGSPSLPNVGTVYIGVEPGSQPIALTQGSVWSFQSAPGANYDLNNFYFSAPNLGDGLCLIYDY